MFILFSNIEDYSEIHSLTYNGVNGGIEFSKKK
jgi:hypothetical protein